MRIRRLAPWSVAAFLFLACLAGGLASPSFEALLEQADAVRSADPGRFQSLLARLNEDAGQATPAQRQRLRYLNAYAQAYSGRYDLAIEQAKALLEATDDVALRFRTGALIANSYAATREFSEALRYLDQMLALLGQVRDNDLRHQGLSVAVVVYNQVGQFDLGRHYAELILSEQPLDRTRCIAAHLRLEALFNLGALPKEDAPIEEVVRQCSAQNERLLANSVRGYLARKWAAEGAPRKAAALLQQHLDEVEATRYPRLIGEIHSLLAEYLLAVGDLAGAERHARRALENSADIAFSLPRVSAYRTLYEVAMRRNDSAAALVNYRRFAEADKAHLDEVKAREMAFQLAKQETLQKTQTIELLNKQNQVLHLQEEVARQTARNTGLLAALLAFLLVSIGYWAYKTKRVQMSLRYLAETDALTGVCNRHHFSRQTRQALTAGARTGEDVSLVMFDLDQFKSINDRFGHAAGDWVLQRTTEACKALCRKNDRVGRLGGEEFAILLVGCGIDSAASLAEQCRERIAAIDSREAGGAFAVSASFGVAAAGASGYDFDTLLVQADHALYRSKREGRNRVSRYDPAAASSAG